MLEKEPGQVKENLKKTVKTLRINNHIIHTIDIDSFIKSLRCPSSDYFFQRPDVFNNFESIFFPQEN